MSDEKMETHQTQADATGLRLRGNELYKRRKFADDEYDILMLATAD